MVLNFFANANVNSLGPDTDTSTMALLLKYISASVLKSVKIHWLANTAKCPSISWFQSSCINIGLISDSGIGCQWSSTHLHWLNNTCASVLANQWPNIPGLVFYDFWSEVTIWDVVSQSIEVRFILISAWSSSSQYSVQSSIVFRGD